MYSERPRRLFLQRTLTVGQFWGDSVAMLGTTRPKVLIDNWPSGTFFFYFQKKRFFTILYEIRITGGKKRGSRRGQES